MISILAVALLAVLACSDADYTQVRSYLGDAKAQSKLGEMYASGEGVPEDDTEAVKWYRRAADQGFWLAQYNLGVMYAKPTAKACPRTTPRPRGCFARRLTRDMPMRRTTWA
jgi:TPR repeat protein